MPSRSAPARRAAAAGPFGMLLLGLVLGAQIPRASAQSPAVPPATAIFRGGSAHPGGYPAAGRLLEGLAWRAPTGGDVLSSAAVAAGMAYIGSGDGTLYALDETTGTVRWRWHVGGAIASTPAVAGGRVYLTTRDRRIVAASAANGHPLWQVVTGPDLAMPWGHETGDLFTSSPAVAPGVIVVGAGDGGVYAIDDRTGAIRWRFQTGGRVRSSPAVASGRVYVGSADGYVYCLGLLDGKLRWRFATAGVSLESAHFGFDRRTIMSSPAVAGGTVFVGGRDGFLYAIAADSGTLRWRFDHEESWVMTSPAVSEGVVYGGSSDGRFVQAVDASSGKEVWRTPVQGIVWSSPAVSGDFIYVGDGTGRFYALDRQSGAVRWTFQAGESIHSSPVVDGTTILFGSVDGGVYALRTGARTVERAVFYDTAYARGATDDDPRTMAQYLAHRGFRILNAAGTLDFLRQHVAAGQEPSVLVFSIDLLPALAESGDSNTSARLLRRYLDAGGKVVWIGIPPLIWPGDPSTGARGSYAAIDWTAPWRLLGVDHLGATFDERTTRPTALGALLGFTGVWRDSWGVDPAQVTHSIATDDWGLATSWFRSYGGLPGTGFFRIWGGSRLAVYLTAEYFPENNFKENRQ